MAEVRLIDANALDCKLDAIAKKYADMGRYEAAKDYSFVQTVLLSAPTIYPESLRPKGRWEVRGGRRYCTNCWKRACVTRDTDDFWYTAGTDFCPNCGADMRGEVDE